MKQDATAISSGRIVAGLAALIVLAAFALRVWGVWFDLPDLPHPDEIHEVHRAVRLGMGSFEWDRTGKGGYFYLLFVEYGVYFVVLRLMGSVESVAEFMDLFIRDPSGFWLIGRTTTAALGALNVWLTYRIGRRVAGEAVGLLAAFFLAFCFLDVLHSHFVTVDVPMTTGVLATVFFAFRILDRGRLRDYLLAGAFAAIATMTKLPAAPVVLVVALCHGLRCRDEHRPWWAIVLDQRIIASGALCLLVYIAGNPGILNNPATLTSLASSIAVGRPQTAAAVVERPEGNISYYARATRDALGWPLSLWVVPATVMALWRRSRGMIVVLLFPALLYPAIVVTGSDWRHARFILPALPFLLIAGAALLWRVTTALLQKSSSRAAFASVFALLLILPPSIEVFRQNMDLCRPGTPSMARHWIEENIPENTRILVEGFPGIRTYRRMCPIADMPQNMQAFARHLEEHSPVGARLVRLRAKAQTEKAFDLAIIEPSQSWITLDEARQRNMQFVVVCREEFVESPQANSDGRRAFYEALQRDPRVRLRKSFAPKYVSIHDSMHRDAHLEIYELKKLYENARRARTGENLSARQAASYTLTAAPEESSR